MHDDGCVNSLDRPVCTGRASRRRLCSAVPMSTWDAWRARSRPIDSGGTTVAAYDLGPSDGRPVTFLHGYPSSSHDIEPAADLLADGWRVLAVDFPGFGASAKPRDHPYSIHAAADVIERLWADAGIASTVLVAHDYGASVGQELLARRAEGALAVEIESVIWMNGGIYPDLHRPTVGQQFLLDPDHGAELAATVTADTFIDGLRVTWGERVPFDDDEMREIWRSMDDGDGVPLMHDLLHYVADRREHQARWQSALEDSDVPMTFVWGDLDPVSGGHMIERVEERIPSATVIRMADVGHWPLLEAPDALAAAISDR
jgi:pimeloyl-ACP methyl ester carboxylesterase